MDLHGDHTSTCTAHSGATKAHDWMVIVIGPLFRTAGHVVRTQHGVSQVTRVTASAGQLRSDVEVRNYLGDQAGSLSLVFDLVEGQPWVPDGSTVGPRFLGGNRGFPHKNRQPWHARVWTHALCAPLHTLCVLHTASSFPQLASCLQLSDSRCSAALRGSTA